MSELDPETVRDLPFILRSLDPERLDAPYLTLRSIATHLAIVNGERFLHYYDSTERFPEQHPNSPPSNCGICHAFAVLETTISASLRFKAHDA